MNKDFIKRLLAFLWENPETTHWQRIAARAGRYLYVLGRDLFEGQLTMRAMSLVYTTLLSIVPMLALAFSVLKAFGVRDSLEPLLLRLLEPLGAQADEITQNVIGFVEKIDVKVLGFFGILLLFYSAVSMIQKVESSFNFIWRIERTRPLSQRLSEYTFVLLLGPVAVFSALGITGTVLNSSVVTAIGSYEPFGSLLLLLTKLIPYLLIIGVFTFMYGFIPNTKVRVRAAFGGGLLAGVLWQTGSVAFATFAANATNYNAIYSSFAILILLLIWIYFGWMILLIGAALAFYIQHPEHLTAARNAPVLSGRQGEYLALLVMALVGRRFISGETPYTQDELALAASADPDHLDRVIETLKTQNLLAVTSEDSRLLPAIDLDSLHLAQLWRRVRSGIVPLPKNHQALAREVTKLLDSVENTFEESTGGLTLRQWLTQGDRK